MFIHVDDLIPGMELDGDISIQAGAYLITYKEIENGRLNEKVIEAVKKFSPQLAPFPNRIKVKDDIQTINHLKSIVKSDVARVIDTIENTMGYPTFLEVPELRTKVMRVIEKLMSNPDIVSNIYRFKLYSKTDDPILIQLLDHTIRVTLLSISLGLKMRCSIVSLLNLGIASIFHDMGIIRTRVYPDLKKLDNFTTEEIANFVIEHQKMSATLFWESSLSMPHSTRNEVLYLIAHHHYPRHDDINRRLSLMLYFAELVDEMITELPYNVRYNFSTEQIKKIGARFTRRYDLLKVIQALIKIYKGRIPEGEIVSGLIQMFYKEELSQLFTQEKQLMEGYAGQVQKILLNCPYNCAMPYPFGESIMPRSIYCDSSMAPDAFSFCGNSSSVKIEIQLNSGRMKSYNKCTALTSLLHELNTTVSRETFLGKIGKRQSSIS
jgi:hypothetical protein